MKIVTVGVKTNIFYSLAAAKSWRENARMSALAIAQKKEAFLNENSRVGPILLLIVVMSDKVSHHHVTATTTHDNSRQTTEHQETKSTSWNTTRVVSVGCVLKGGQVMSESVCQRIQDVLVGTYMLQE